MDGTLLRSDERPSKRTVVAVDRVVGCGAVFAIATGRPPRWLEPILAELNVQPLAVCANGSIVYDSQRRTTLKAFTLSPATLEDLIESAARLIPTCSFAVERHDEDLLDVSGAFAAEETYEHPWPNANYTIASREDLAAAPAIKLLLRASEFSSSHLMDRLAPHIEERASITYSSPAGIVEMAPYGVSKLTGVKWIATRYRIDRIDSIIFGDMPNDLQMLRWAGRSIAMGNAHQDIRAIASEVAASNNHDGVAAVLERYF